MAQPHIHYRTCGHIHIHFIHSFLSQSIAKREGTYLIPTQNPVYQIISLIQNPVCHPSFPQHRTQCIDLSRRYKILCADQTHTRHSLHSHHQLVSMYPLPSSQNTGSHFSRTIPILNSATSLLGSQSMVPELDMMVHSLEYGDETIRQFYAYLPKYLKTSLQNYRRPGSKRLH
jgi:hypothetical protein